jgi:hypothetical protein
MKSTLKVKVKQRGEAIFGTIVGVLIGIAALSAWFTHVYVCFSDNRWGFLIAGALFFPVAIVHGVGLWFGFW